MNKKQIIEEIADILDEYSVVFLDGLDEAILGFTHIQQDDRFAIVYSISAILKQLQTIHNMTEEEATEWYEFNIACMRDCVFVND